MLAGGHFPFHVMLVHSSVRSTRQGCHHSLRAEEENSLRTWTVLLLSSDCQYHLIFFLPGLFLHVFVVMWLQSISAGSPRLKFSPLLSLASTTGLTNSVQSFFPSRGNPYI